MLKDYPLWVQLQSLPISYCGTDSLNRITNAIGVPCCADVYITRRKRVQYTITLVKVDIIRPLVNELEWIWEVINYGFKESNMSLGLSSVKSVKKKGTLVVS